MRERLEQRDELRRRRHMTEREASVRRPNVRRPSTERRLLEREELELLPCLLSATEPREHARAECSLVERIHRACEKVEYRRQASLEVVEPALEIRPGERMHRERPRRIRV